MGRLRLRSRASIGGESGSLLDAVTDLVWKARFWKASFWKSGMWAS